jgi:hypothetical protein
VKIEHLIVQHLYISKQVTLQGIGTFRLDPSIILPAENEKERDFVIPDNAFQFTYNLKAEEDDALIKYIVQHTRKMLPLASADLDSYVTLAKQFLNIGKPLVIEGIGTIQKNQVGEYQFTPGHFALPKIDDIPKQVKEKKEEAISFESQSVPKNNGRRNLMIFVTLLILGGTAFGIYYMVTQQPIESVVAPPAEVKKNADTVSNTANDTTVVASGKPADSTTVQPAINIPGADNKFNVVLRQYDNEIAADKALKKFTTYGHKMTILKIDSANFLLAMPFDNPLSDTTRIKDSLGRFFGGKPSVRF